MFRQYLTILIIILFNTITVFAQKTVTRLEYEKAVDNLNCEVAKYYIERNQGTYELEAYNDSIARFGCNFEHLMVFLKERHLQMEQNAYLAEYIEQLKKEYDLLVMNTSLYDRMVDVFKEDALKVYEPREDYQAFKKNLLAQLKEDLRTDEVAENKEQLQNTSNFWSYFENLEKSNVLLIFLLIFLFLIILAIFRWGIKYTRTGKNENTFPTSYKPKPSSPVNPAITDAAKSAVKTLPTEATKSITQEQPEQELESPSVHEEIEVFDENIFYMPYPKIDGSFYENNRLAAFVYGKSTFKFEIKIAEYSLATFSPISNDDVITDIFMDYEKTIKSVCEIEGNPTDLKKVIKPGMTKIVTVVPGMAQRSNQHWRLKQKAIIRFEYE